MRLRLLRPVGLGVIAMILVALSARLRSQNELRVNCLPDRATALPGEAVNLNVWVASATGPSLERVFARWETTAGRVESQSPATRWMLDGAQVDQRHTAVVSVEINGRLAGSCVLGVWVIVPPPKLGPLRGEYITRRAFLRAGQIGEPGYGLYSYFLMREPASPTATSRAARFVSAFLDVLPGVADQESYVERRRLNGSYLPVTSDPPQGMTTQQRSGWALEHYDYDRAKSLLSFYPTLSGPGPFIVVVPAPLRTPVKPMLPWDFSQLETGAIGEGVSRFLNQAAQLYDWQNQSALQQLRDRLFTAVAGMFVGRTTAEHLVIVRYP